MTVAAVVVVGLFWCCGQLGSGFWGERRVR